MNTLSKVKLCDSINFVKSTFYLNKEITVERMVLEFFYGERLMIVDFDDVEVLFLLFFEGEGSLADYDSNFGR